MNSSRNIFRYFQSNQQPQTQNQEYYNEEANVDDDTPPE